uniref:Uncharacterized protein n=1 Tax=Oryza brachyantha TaxID=4533 RepID=J3N1X9_ORYBR
MLWSEFHSWRSSRIRGSHRYYCESIYWGARNSTNIKNFSYWWSIYRDTADLVRSPSNGEIQFNRDLVHPTCTRHGQPAFLCYIDLHITIQSQDILH